MSAPTRHRRLDVNGIDAFYREAGPADAPVLLLPHGYPASSFVYRNLMPALGDRWRTVAPDLPGFGYSGTPSAEDFEYTFDARSSFLADFVDALGLDRYAVWLHDYGSQLGFRLAMSAHPGPDARRAYAEHVSLDGFRDEFAGELPGDVADRVPPDLWTLYWALMSTQERRANLVRLLEDQPSTLPWFPANAITCGNTGRPP